VCTRQILGMKDGQARYSIVCNEHGGCRDDVLVYRLAEDDYMMVCNAANRAKLLDHFEAVKDDLVYKLEDITEMSAMLAVQGPRVMDLISKYSSEIPQLKRYRFLQRNILGLKVMVSRTGYTGEDGVEVMFRTDSVVAKFALKTLVKDLTAIGDVVKLVGLGARDSLRLEAAMALYGHEITEDLDPISAGLDFAVKATKGDEDPEAGSFIGQDVIRRLKADGPERALAGLVLDSPRAARQDMPVLKDGTTIGFVTSGCLSPTLERSIAMAYLDAAHAEPGGAVEVDLGRQCVTAEIVPLPFYKAG
jgi:aminomethyltransferase